MYEILNGAKRIFVLLIQSMMPRQSIEPWSWSWYLWSCQQTDLYNYNQRFTASNIWVYGIFLNDINSDQKVKGIPHSYIRQQYSLHYSQNWSVATGICWGFVRDERASFCLQLLQPHLIAIQELLPQELCGMLSKSLLPKGKIIFIFIVWITK